MTEKVWLAIISSLLVPIVGCLVWAIKSKFSDKKKANEDKLKTKQKHDEEVKDLKLRIEKQKELLNYLAGQCDMICQPSIKVDPEVREAMKKGLKRYHTLDLVKLVNRELEE